MEERLCFLLLAVDLHKHIVFPLTLPQPNRPDYKKLNQPVRGTKVTRKEEFGHSAWKTPQNGRGARLASADTGQKRMILTIQ